MEIYIVIMTTDGVPLVLGAFQTILQATKCLIREEINEYIRTNNIMTRYRHQVAVPQHIMNVYNNLDNYDDIIILDRDYDYSWRGDAGAYFEIQETEIELDLYSGKPARVLAYGARAFGQRHY
jgi:hypothetical protein